MRILQVCAKFHPYVASGSTKVAYHISKELAKRGYSVTVYTSNMKDKYNRIINGDGVEELDGIHVRRFKTVAISATREMKFFITPTLIKMSKEEIRSFDIIHLHEYTTFQNIIIYHYARKYGVPYVLQAHGSLPRIGAWRRLKWLYDVFFGYRLLRDAAKVIALGRIEAEQYRRMGVPEEKIAIIPNGIDLSEYANLPPKGSFKKKFNIDEDEKIILYLGRINKIKGIDVLVKAFGKIIGQIGNTKLVIVGPNDGYSHELRDSIRNLAIEHSVFVTGPLYGKAKLEPYVDAEVFVLPSRYETFPLTILEAIACGTPFIITENCGVADYFRNKVGLVVRPDSTQLSDALIEMLCDKSKQDTFRKNCRTEIERFSISNTVSMLEEIYEEIAGYGRYANSKY